MNKLLNSNDNFSDYQIQTNDFSKISIHKLILLTRFNNDKTIFQKFINICKLKPKREIFKQKENKITEFLKEIGIESNWIKQKKGRKGIIKDLTKLYEEETTKDFTIIVSEKEIKVHKLILIIRSELFKGMFLSVQDSSNQVHDYSRKSFETIQQLIYFLYHDKFYKERKGNNHQNNNQNYNNNIEEFKDLKDFYQLNQNSIIDLFLKKLK
ncbi:hypothetical protein M0811_07955 [Anaeramoeba ignava]|uniref:BTB domain-containing protein n=1 Tax=Anaeramoeba ignava TaxID=1746090 RepID=A0A9Q0LL46_ANAIG|nr:hypothetical protein M0811_07955 [Anaeramoeba ignava]